MTKTLSSGTKTAGKTHILLGNRPITLAAITLIILSIYMNSLDVPFIFDDHTYIKGNPAVCDARKIFSPSELDALQVEADVANNVRTRPLSYLSFGINHALHGFNVQGYHVVNIALHAGNAVLLYLLLVALSRQLTGGLSDPAANRSVLTFGDAAAFFSTLLFAVHPVQTNVVTYITQRMASLATLCYLLASVLYTVWRSRDSRGWKLYAGALAASVAGMFSKEICFTLPLMLVCIELLFFRERLPVRLRILAPFMATMAIIPIRVMEIAISSTDSFSAALAKAVNLVNSGATSWYGYFVTQLRVLVTYLRILVIPYDLHLDRDFPRYTSLREPEVLSSGLFLLGLLAGASYLIWRSRTLDELPRLCMRMTGFGIIWFFTALSVESGLIPINDVIFEYRLYLPSIGYFCAAIYGVGGLVVAWKGSTSALRRMVLIGMAALVVTIFAVTTVARNRIWQDDELFWRDAIAKSPDKYGNYLSLANVLRDHAKIGEAMAVLSGQAERRPGLAHPVYEMGLLCLETQRPEQAIDHFFEALAKAPNRPEIYRGLILAFLDLGNHEGASALYWRAREMFPGFRPIYELDAFVGGDRKG